MDESLLLKVSIACSLMGLFLIFLFSETRGITEISALTIDDVGRIVSIDGVIASSRISNNHVFWGIDDGTGQIKFVIFNTSAIKMNQSGISPYDIGPGTRIRASGFVDEYPKGSGIIEIIYKRGDIEIGD